MTLFFEMALSEASLVVVRPGAGEASAEQQTSAFTDGCASRRAGKRRVPQWVTSLGSRSQREPPPNKKSNSSGRTVHLTKKLELGARDL